MEVGKTKLTAQEQRARHNGGHILASSQEEKKNMLNARCCNLIKEAGIRVKSTTKELCALLRERHKMASWLPEGEADVLL